MYNNMVIADGSVGSDYDHYDDMHNEIDISHIKNMIEITEWLIDNISEKNEKWYWYPHVVIFKDYDDAWQFMEWLEEYERK